MRNKPRIRFKGFTEDWEQREFSDIFAEVKSGLSRMLSNDDIGLPVVRANNINDGQLNLVDDIKYWYKNDPQGANTNNYLIDQGDILINFINSEAKMGTAAYVTRRPERDTIYTTNILRCKVNDEYNPYFIYSLTFLNSYKNYIASITKPAVNQASFTTVDFKKYSIKIPTVKEQNQIADLIETFNKLITLHQRKLEKLKLAKKALLQKLFPKNGSKFPELRFKGFADAWEQRKVNEIFKVTRGQVLAASLTTPEKNRRNIYPVYSSQTKDNGLLGYYSEYLFENAITWTTDGANAGTVNFRPGRFYSTNVNGVLINENGYACYAVSEIINKFAYKYVSKVGNPKLMNNVMAEINIMITPDIDELKQISKLIEAYNQYITLHQRKLDKLQEVKKGLLQKMFV